MRWGRDNRTCSLRMVGHSPASVRVENRTPGGDVNPYLAVAAMVAAALHGIENELTLEPECTGNAYDDETRPQHADVAARGAAASGRASAAGPGGVR